MAIRLRVLEDYDAGLGTRSVVCKYRVSESWVRRLKQRHREDHRLMPRPAGNPTPAKLNGYHPQLHVAAASTIDRVIYEIG